MVNDRGMRTSDDEYRYDELDALWPTERPSKKRRRQRPKQPRDRQVVVRATTNLKPDPARISRALMAAQREMARAQADAEARAQVSAASDGKAARHREGDAR